MIALAEIFLMVINLVMAAIHASMIMNEKKIKHAAWGALYLGIAGSLSMIFNSWELMVSSIFVRKVFFDLSLNIFRDKPLFYVSKTTTSIIDRFHNKLFKDRSEIYMTIYFMVCVLFIIYFLHV